MLINAIVYNSDVEQNQYRVSKTLCKSRTNIVKSGCDAVRYSNYFKLIFFSFFKSNSKLLIRTYVDASWTRHVGQQITCNCVPEKSFKICHNETMFLEICNVDQ